MTIAERGRLLDQLDPYVVYILGFGKKGPYRISHPTQVEASFSLMDVMPPRHTVIKPQGFPKG